MHIPEADLYFFPDPALALLIHPNLELQTVHFLRYSMPIATPMLINSLIRLAGSRRVAWIGLLAMMCRRKFHCSFSSQSLDSTLI